MKLTIPKAAGDILNTLHANGYEAYVVGGCVRDTILGRIPGDWDITTSALPEDVKKLFRRTIDTGIQHGTVTVMCGDEGYEITTYRIDGDYIDGRHPENVTFTASLEEDLKRRDFTINAMAYNDTEGLVDLFDGIGDLERGVIRCVGDAKERFGEDALRILRAVRFSAQLNFDIEASTAEAIKELSPTLSKISSERICAEILKLITSPHPDFLRKAWELGITKVVLPEFDTMMETEQNTPHHCYSVGEHTLKAMMEVPSKKTLRLTMLLHDVAKPDCHTTDPDGRDHFKGHAVAGVAKATDIMYRMKLDNHTIKEVSTLIRYHDWRMNPVDKEVRRALNKVGVDLFPDLMKVQLADMLAKSDYRLEEKLARIYDVEKVYKEILEKQECVSLKDLAINGKDVIAAGVKPGPGLGKVLEGALEQVLDDPARNSKEWLINWIYENA